VIQIGPLMIDHNLWNDKEIRKNPFFCPDKETVPVWEQYLLDIRKAGSSCGAIIELRAKVFRLDWALLFIPNLIKILLQDL
ncbi:MAG: chorismate synthase, partial [Pseudomonadota bacterium]